MELMYPLQQQHELVPNSPVLQDVEADSAVGVDVGVKHLGEELDDGRLVGVLLAELHGELEGPVLEGGVVRAEDDGVPQHDVVLARGARHPRGGVLLQALEVAHQSAAGGGRHGWDGEDEDEEVVDGDEDEDLVSVGVLLRE